MNKQLRLALCILICLAPLIYLAAIWPALPQTVPTHFDLAGHPNGYSSKESLWIINGSLAAVGMGLYLLLRNLHRIDPKRSGRQPSATFGKLAFGMPVFLSAINLVAVFSTTHTISAGKVLFPLLGLLFAFLGNVLYSIQPNYFAGIRLPWTLADDANWRATHRLAGKLWFAGGLCLAVGALLLPAHYTAVLLFLLIGVMVGIPVGYSFLYFKRHQHKSSL